MNNEADELAMLLRLAVHTGRLTDMQRTAVEGILLGKSTPETAAAAGVARGSIWSAEKLAFRKLRRQLRKFGFEDFRSVSGRFLS